MRTESRPQQTARVATICAVALLLIVFSNVSSAQTESDGKVLGTIHDRLLDKGRIASDQPFIFVGNIARLGPPFEGPCNKGLGDVVDYSVSHLVWGKFTDPTAHAVYITCGHAALPAPPFTMGAKMIVYCEHPQGALTCLDPIPYSDDTLQRTQQWTASLPSAPER